MAFGFYNHIISLSHTDTKLINTHRLHIITIRSYHSHFEMRNTHIKKSHRRSIDKAKPYFFSLLKECFKLRIRIFTIHQKSISTACDIGKVSITHTHFIPHFSIGKSRSQTVFFDLIKKIAHRALRSGIIITHLFELSIHAIRLFITPIRK
ncbi:hypothetical protein MNB_SV-13-226 [hydrothermal vent metagenome]|uniref:Uncharacterized protein n=1 Tax=hydrothermal vent metagenome TaxID=652676 RepID=A0A1W1D182_9ZZZZ